MADAARNDNFRPVQALRPPPGRERAPVQPEPPPPPPPVRREEVRAEPLPERPPQPPPRADRTAAPPVGQFLDVTG